MTPIAKKCPCCNAPLDLVVDGNNVDICEYCNTKVYISDGMVDPMKLQLSEDFMLVADPDKEYMPQTADPIRTMRGSAEVPKPPPPPPCLEISAQRRDALNRLNASRAAAPPPLTYNELHGITQPPLSQSVKEGLWDLVTLPFKILAIMIEAEGDRSVRNRHGRRRRRW
ncbi:MAG: hypothetical protein FWG45_01040 [Oscillospiraceae bacterium]|nr:hypothetical protein [Oscillospiraceae bacterium]